MNQQTILALAARHALTTAAGALAAHGYLQSSTTEQFVSAGMLIAGVLWSWWQKKGQAEAIATLNTIINYRRNPGAAAGPAAQVAVQAGAAPSKQSPAPSVQVKQ